MSLLDRCHSCDKALAHPHNIFPAKLSASGFTDARFIEMLVAKYRSVRYAVALALADLVDDPGSSVKMDDAFGLLRKFSIRTRFESIYLLVLSCKD
jgi:hypothetical protein